MRHTAIWACPYSKSSFNPMTLITLLTDFGTRDEYVGVMKGVIAGINPDVRIVDISHHIDPQDIVHGAFILAARPLISRTEPFTWRWWTRGWAQAVESWPSNVADSALSLLIMAFLSVLWPIIRSAKPSQVTDPRYQLDRVSCTFHGRDIFAPVAARLAAGLSLRELGPVVDRQSIVCGVIPRCRFSSQDCIDGAVVAADRFGNLMTTIDAAALDRLRRRTGGKPIVVELSGKAVGGLVASYDRVPRVLCWPLSAAAACWKSR
jgi:S-adenosylmethionine hydrolase